MECRRLTPQRMRCECRNLRGRGLRVGRLMVQTNWKLQTMNQPIPCRSNATTCRSRGPGDLAIVDVGIAAVARCSQTCRRCLPGTPGRYLDWAKIDGLFRGVF